MHLVTYMNCEKIPLLILVQYKGVFSEMEFTVSLFSNVRVVVKHGFLIFLANLMHILLYKDGIVHLC